MEQVVGRWPVQETISGAVGAILRPPSSDVARQVLDGLDGIVSVLRRRANDEIDADGALAVIAQTRSLLSIIFNRNEEDSRDTPAAVRKRDRAMTAVAYIDEHLDQKLSMPVLAAIVGMSEPLLALSFREAMGCSPNDYARMRKIERAVRLSEKGGLAVSEVAAQCGFDDAREVERIVQRRDLANVEWSTVPTGELRRAL